MRVRKTSFILATILTPIGIGLIAFVSGYMASSNMGDQLKIALVDQSNYLDSNELSSNQYLYTEMDQSFESLKDKYLDMGYDLLIEIPEMEDLKVRNHNVNFYSADKLSLINLSLIERSLSKALKKYKISKSSIDQQTLDELEVDVNLENANVNTTEKNTSDKSTKMSSIISSVLGYIMGFLMYMVIFIYGSMVMRSVMEEKINRIVEVVISSVKPFTLMLGKIIGVGLVGLTQLTIWMILIPILLTVVSMTMGLESTAATTTGDAAEMVKQLEQSGELNIQNIVTEIKDLNWLIIIPSFIIFFLGGYFIYSSLFAAVGSAIGDDLGEGQQLMLPIIIPVVMSIIMVPAVVNNHDGTISIFLSIFPLFSPILMPARLPFDPPAWEIAVSMITLIVSVIFMVWLTGRIYRVGILMYGKKVSFKELGKWLFYKG